MPLENSTDVTKLIVDEFKISMDTNGGDASWLNGKTEIHNRIIHNMVREGILGSNQHEKKWCQAVETPAELHGCRIHSDLDNI